MTGSAAAESEDLAAPLYVAWQITNECNLACLHCIEESGPGKAFADELDRDQVFAVLDQLLDSEVPYLSFSGGEPMLHPHFFAMVERACERGAQLKIETNAHYLDRANAARLKELGVKAVQVSLDGASVATFGRMRVRGEFDRVLDGVRNLRDAGVPIEINFSPASFNLHEVDAVVDLAYELGAYSFYTGRTMYTGNAVKAWRHLEVTEDQYVAFFDALRREDRAVPRAHARLLPRGRAARGAALSHPAPGGLADRAAQRPRQAHQRPALHLRRLPARQPRRRSGARFRSAWHDPRVARFVEDLATDPGRTRTLHQWVYL